MFTETDTNLGRPTVWIVNEGGHDYTPAKTFGNPIALTAGSINPFNLDRLMVIIAPKIELAKETDYLLISGPPSVNAIALAMWLKKFPRVTILQWSARQGVYVPTSVSNAAIEKNALGGVRIA